MNYIGLCSEFMQIVLKFLILFLANFFFRFLLFV